MKVLIARTDKLGDVVLSLPVFADIKAQRPDWQVHALVSEATVPLLESHPDVDAIWTYNADRLPQLAADLAAESYAAAVLLFYDRKLAAALRRIGIRLRIGPLSKWSSWFYLNRPVWQRRSRARHHERDYNLQLARKLTGASGDYPDPRLHLTGGQLEIGARFRADAAPGAEAVIFVHPGMAGSALNWPAERYAEVANLLSTRPGSRVFLTGGAGDQQVIEDVAARLRPEVQVIAGRYPLRDFLGVLSGGDLLIGPSTGPLHMAAALGLAVVGIYSPVLCQSPARWGPLGPRAHAVVPEVRCPARLLCFRERCRLYNCMADVSVESVVKIAQDALRERSPQDRHSKRSDDASVPR